MVRSLVLLARSRPAWLTALWGVCLALSVLLSSRSARASEAEGEGFTSTFAALSATVAATFQTTPVSQSSEPEETPAMREPLVPSWVVGFCDARGASAIAPLPALPTQDGTVAADDGPCQSTALRAGRTVERNETPDHPTMSDALDVGVFFAALPFPARDEPRLLPPMVADRTALPQGFARGIDEPPRGLASRACRRGACPG